MRVRYVLLSIPSVVWALILLLAGPKICQAQDEAVSAPAVITARSGDGDALDLDAAVTEVLRANDLLRAERIKRQELSGQMNQALSTGLPTLDLVGNWNRGRDPSFALDSTFAGGEDTFAPIPGADPWFNDFLAGFGSFIPSPQDIPAQTFWRANLNLNWEINPSKVLGAVGAARLGIDRQEAALLAVKHKTVQDAVTAYYGIIRAAQKVVAVEAHLRDQRELLDTVRLRQELGLATALDTLQAAVGLANTKPQLAVARADLRNAGSRLNMLMGLAPSAPLRIVNEATVEWGELDETVALELSTRRPQVQVAAKFIAILDRNRQAQQADQRPYLTVNGSYGYVGRTVGSLFDAGHDSWRASVALNIPVFDGLLTKGLVTETEAKIQRSRAELRARQNDAQLETLELLADLKAARGVLAAVRLNVRQSGDVLQESMLRLKLGKAGYLDVLVAEANLADARAALINARYDVLTRTAALKRALGFSPLLPLTGIPGLVAEGNPPQSEEP